MNIFPNVPRAAGVPSVLRNVQGVVNDVGNAVNAVANARGLVQQAVNGVAGAINGAISQAQAAVGNIQSAVASAFTGAIGQAETAITGAIGNATAGINTAIANVTANVNLAIGSVSGALDAVNDAIGGVQDQIDGAAEAASDDGSADEVLTDDAPNVQAANQPRWAITDTDGNPLIVPDSFKSTDTKQDWNVSNYPIEESSFASYNKVTTPYEVRVTVTKGGGGRTNYRDAVSQRAEFLQSITDLADSTQLCNVVTPEVTYLDMTITHYAYRRSAANGVSLLTVDIAFQHIRESAASAFTNTKEPDGADNQHSGTVQASTPQPAQQSTQQSMQQSSNGKPT